MEYSAPQIASEAGLPLGHSRALKGSPAGAGDRDAGPWAVGGEPCDGAPGVINAIETCFPPSSAAAVLEHVWPDFKGCA